MSRSKDPVVVTRRRHVDEFMPLDLKRELFSILSDQMRREVEKRGLCEEELEAEFETWREKQPLPPGV